MEREFFRLLQMSLAWALLLSGPALLLWRRRCLPRLALLTILLGVSTSATHHVYSQQEFANIDAAWQRLMGPFDFTTLEYQGLQPLTLRNVNGRTQWSEPFTMPLCVESKLLIAAIEDRRFWLRLAEPDLRSEVRAVRSWVWGGPKTGASSVPEQLAGILLGIRTRRPDGSLDFAAKLHKKLAGIYVGDKYSRDAIINLYAWRVPIGAIHGVELFGLEAAAIGFYGRRFDELPIEARIEILIRLRAPRETYPWRLARESESQFAKRMDSYFSRYNKAIEIAAEEGLLTAADAKRAATRGVFLCRLLTKQDSRAILERPFRAITTREALAGRRWRAPVALHLESQTTLEFAGERTHAELAALPIVKRHTNTELIIEAIHIAANGELLAEIGDPRTAAGASSFVKPFLVALAIERGVLQSVDSIIPGTPATARQMLVKSDNRAAVRLARLVGPANFAELLRSCGFTLPAGRVSAQNALGAGAVASLSAVAACWGFNPHRPGQQVEISRFRSPQTPATQVFNEAAALQVHDALRDAARTGTAQQLREFASRMDIACKTGSAGFRHRRTGRWLGEGGSTALCSLPDGSTLAVRVRYADGAPFEISASSAAVNVVRRFLENYYFES